MDCTQIERTIVLADKAVNAEDPVPERITICQEAPAQLPATRLKPHNRPMADSAWQQRIRRAESLAKHHAFAKEILGFYIQVARFQEQLYRRLTSIGVSVSLAGRLESPELLASFSQFLALVQSNGPEQLAQVARELRSASDANISDLLHAVWINATEAPSNSEQFLAFAFLQPCAELVRSQSRLQTQNYTLSLCPLCNRKPALGVLRQMGDGGQRNLVCGFCLTEWEFRRIICPGCGEEKPDKIPVYTAETIPHIRVECCDTCQTYIKSIDLTKNGLADPLVDELASVPLDLWAQEHGYEKLHPNLLGM
jgi:FdhE protein